MRLLKKLLIRYSLSTKRVYWVLQHWQKWIEKDYAARYVCDSLRQLYQNSNEKYLLQDIDQALLNGRLMADGFTGWLPSHTVKWLANCERSKHFSTALQWIIGRIASKEQVLQQCITKLSYSVSIFAFSIIQLLIIVDDNLIGILDSLIDQEKRTAALKIAIAASLTIKQYYFEMGLGFAGFVLISVGVFKWFNSLSCKVVDWGNYLPLNTWYRQYMCTAILSEAALLVQSGYNWKLALQICDSESKGIRAIFCTRTLNKLSEGKSATKAFVESKLLSQELCLQLAGLVDGQLPAITVLELCSEQLSSLETLFLRKIAIVQFFFIGLTVMNMLVLISGLYSIR